MDVIYAEYASKQENDPCKTIRFQDIMDDYFSSAKVIPEMLNAATALRRHGIKTCILTNNWTNDIVKNYKLSPFPHLLHYFDEVFESCKIGFSKPDPEIYSHVCSKMAVQPSEVIFLDDSPQNLKTAKGMGMLTILVKNPITALRDLKKITGIDVFQQHAVEPCAPHDAIHCYVNLKASGCTMWKWGMDLL